MTNRQLNFENIHRVENLTYESLEKKYINVQVVGTVLTYIGMMLLVLFILLVEKLSYRTFIVAGMGRFAALFSYYQSDSSTQGICL